MHKITQNLEISMESFENYFQYLKRRSYLGRLYRNFIAYPKLSKKLNGLTLDVGCGIGDLLAFRKNTIGTDINPLLIEFCRQNGNQVFQMEPNKLPFMDGEFDSILLDNVLEHIEDPDLLLLEIKRVLRKGGHFIAGVPGSLGYQLDPDHKVFYDEISLRHLLMDYCFTPITFFGTPFLSNVLSKRMPQYCVYGVFLND